MTKQDILEYLNNLRKSSDEDPSNKWLEPTMEDK
jgi:hypothetical protein